jgi:AraC family transcriptional regulator
MLPVIETNIFDHPTIIMAVISAASVKASKVTSGILYSSDFCELKSWEYDFKKDRSGSQGYNDCLCLVYVRKGDFLFSLAHQSYDTHTGHIVIDKPGYEYDLRPSAGELTIFNFTNDFYNQFVEDCNLKQSFFFSNPDIVSLMIKATAEIDYLYFEIHRRISCRAGKLEIDNLVLEFVKAIVFRLADERIYPIRNSAKALHLRPVEAAKEYINSKFGQDISLYDLADHCCLSPFHFTRIFKRFTSYTPHQYLQNIRLKHAETLLRSSNLPVYEIALQSGFNSIEYFGTAFKQKFSRTPSQFRVGK